MEQHNPLLTKLRIPGETYRLPSHGLFYTNGELDPSVKNGEVEVHPLTAQDEIVLNTPDKLLSGKAIDEIFMRCIPQILKPRDLIAKDIDFLMVCLRLVTFGPVIDVTFKHTCKDAKEHTYQVNLSEMVRTARAIDPTTLSSDYAVTLPTGHTATLRPLTQGSLLELYQTTTMTSIDNISEAEAELMIVDALAGVVYEVDGVTDRSHIREWVKQLPLASKRMLETAAQRTAHWGVNFETKHTCQDCGKEIVIPVTPNPVSFFS